MIKPATNKTFALLKTTRSTILPFTEQPSMEPGKGKKNNDPLNAAELFSMFTADIIKEKVVFTR